MTRATDEFRRRLRVVTVAFSASVREAPRRGALGTGPQTIDLLQEVLDGHGVTTLPFLPVELAQRPGEGSGWSGGVCQIALRACTAPRLARGKGWTPGYLPGGGRLAHPEVGEQEGGNRWRRRYYAA